MRYLALALSIAVVVSIMAGCADLRERLQPRKVCTMDEWIVTSDCP